MPPKRTKTKRKYGQWGFWRDIGERPNYPWYTAQYEDENHKTFGVHQNTKTTHMTRKSQIIPFLHLQKNHTYRILFTLDAITRMDENNPIYEEELDAQHRAIQIIYYMNVIVPDNYKTYNPKNGRLGLKLVVIETNVPGLSNREHIFDAHDFTGNPVDITSQKQLESWDGDMFAMVMQHARRNRELRGERPIPFSEHLDRLRHEKLRTVPRTDLVYPSSVAVRPDASLAAIPPGMSLTDLLLRPFSEDERACSSLNGCEVMLRNRNP